MAKKTQGTVLYFIDAPTTVVAIQCPTGITGVSAPREQIETTCLEADAKSFIPGLRSPGAVSVALNFDPSQSSHKKIWDMYEAGTQGIKFALGWSDGTDVPTASGGDFTLPTTRTFTAFTGFFTDVPQEFALNAVVTATVQIQTSGAITLTPKT